MTTWTDADHRLADNVRANAVTAAVLAIEHALPETDREKILARFRHSNLNGADVADILDILDNHDALLEHTEPFYDDNHDVQVRAALGWPAPHDDGYDPDVRPDRDVMYASMLRGRLIGFAVLAIALLTDQMPDVQAVTDLVRAADAKIKEGDR